MNKTNRKFAKTNSEGHVDLQKARQAELFLGFFTGFPTDDELITRKMIRNWIQFVNNPDNHLKRIRSIGELDDWYKNFHLQDKLTRDIGVILHLEGAAGIDSNFDLLHIYYDIGLRSMSLTWNEQNKYATGVKGDKDKGLSEVGIDLIDRMEELGIIVDVSHLNDKSFWDLIDTVKKPIIASHSNLRNPANTPRNLTDDMVMAIADTGGSIGINFCRDFLSHDQEIHKSNRGCAKWMINRVVELVGPEHVHIGSDFDGCTTPDDIEDITSVQLIFDELSKDLDTSVIDNIKHGNMIRIIRECW